MKHNMNAMTSNEFPACFRVFDAKTATQEEILELWEKVSREDYAFDDITRDNLQAFCLLLASPGTLIYLYGENGAVMFTNVIPTLRADIHHLFFGPVSLRRFMEDVKQLIDWIMDVGKLSRLTTYVVEGNDYADRMSVKCGFQFEGRMRKYMPVHGELRDVKLYGLVKEN